MPEPSKRRPFGAFAAIGLAVLLPAMAFGYAGGWFSPALLTPGRMIQALVERGGDPVGYRRNHAKGTCFTGTFDANGTAVPYSKAPMFAAGHYPLIGRFSIATGDPQAPDFSGRVKGMGLQITAPDGEQWRSAMIDAPVFVTNTPRGFYELTVASKAVGSSGKPDPAAIKQFFVSHPESVPFLHWVMNSPLTASWVDTAYHGLSAFIFIDAAGDRHPVRWMLQPTLAVTPKTQAELAQLGPDYLQRDLEQRLHDAAAPIAWHMLVTLGNSSDPTAQAATAWPAERPQIDIGTIRITGAGDDRDGICRDVNFDPLVLPNGIIRSDDPLLAARSATYARSFDLRTAELKQRLEQQRLEQQRLGEHAP